MKLKLTEYVEATNEEIGDAFGQMNAGEQADFLKALEDGLMKSCEGDLDLVRNQYNMIAMNLKSLGVQGIVITPENIEITPDNIER